MEPLIIFVYRALSKESASEIAEIPLSESIAELRDGCDSRMLYRLLSFGTSVADDPDAGSGENVTVHGCITCLSYSDYCGATHISFLCDSGIC